MGCEGGFHVASDSAFARVGIAKERDFKYRCGGGDATKHFEPGTNCENPPWGATCAQNVPNKQSGYWKATGPNKFIGRGTQVADLCRGFSKGIFPTFSDVFFPRKCWKISFGKSLIKIGNLCTPTYKFIWPGCLPVAS